MELTHASYKNCDLVRATGRIDSSTSPELEEKLKQIQSGGRNNIVLDMSAVEFMSSRGLWVLVEAQKASKNAKGQIVLASVPEKIMESLKLVGMTNYFRFFDDVVGAVGNF